MVPCRRCEYQAKTKRRLVEHELAVHDGMKYPFPQCDPWDLCDGKENRKEHLLRHKKNKHEGVRIPCEQCGLLFSDKSVLTRNIRPMH